MNEIPTDITALSPLTRWKRAFEALAKVLSDPTQTDQVLVFSSYINAGSIKSRMHRFFDHPVGARLFATHATIDSKTVDLDALIALPDDTLGHAYAKFLRSRGLTPEVFDAPPEGIADPKASYIMQRMRQTHDLWHVVTGAQTDTPGEIGLLAFTYAQSGAPSSGMLAVMGTLRTAKDHPAIATSLARDVLANFLRGKRAERLAVFPWEEHWATPLADVRAMLGLPVVPPVRSVPLAA